MIRFLLISIFLIFFSLGIGQVPRDSAQAKGPTEIDILFNYYEQDGIHSAVTGGQGTEELRDMAAKIIVHVPLDTASAIDIQGSINQYTSASTDKIDSYVSSASIKDAHANLIFAYSKEIIPNKLSWSVFAGGGIESDYISSSFGGGLVWNNPQKNRELALRLQVFLDTWIVIFPEELRAPGLVSLPTDKRRSYNFSGTYSQVINPRLQASVSGELVVQQGLLSTPFHRVYFQGKELPDIERLPALRIKYPIGFRVNYFPTDFMVLRTYYRFYYDNWDLLAHTINVELPIKPSPFFTLFPYTRLHYQRASRYFAPFGQHLSTEEYYTSDYDLSGFGSLKVGMGIRYAPVFGLLRFKLRKGRIGMLKSIEIRGSLYRRSDGLKAWTTGLNLGWEG
ncbi:MAG: DUF3570 domain-containing protein [Bacteroidia bacterium]|nr:DUF3570 domain-containing protein [Bacteroidia bacterium]